MIYKIRVLCACTLFLKLRTKHKVQSTNMRPTLLPCSRLPLLDPFRIIHGLLEGTGPCPVGFAPTFSFGQEPRRVGDGKRIDCSTGS